MCVCVCVCVWFIDVCVRIDTHIRPVQNPDCEFLFQVPLTLAFQNLSCDLSHFVDKSGYTYFE